MLRSRRGIIAGLVTGIAAITSLAGAVYAIEGGQEATAENAPTGMVQVSSGGALCGGTLIQARWVLTAAHCMRGDAAHTTVRAGSRELNRGTALAVSATHTAPGADITLLELQSDAAPAPVPLADTNPAVDATGDIFGWGRVGATPDHVSNTLKTARVEVRRVGGNCTDHRRGPGVCVTRVTGQARSGDSGGPLLVNGRQVGVASTAGGANATYAGVADNLPWIEQTTGLDLNADGRVGACSPPPWDSGKDYPGGTVVSHNGRNWKTRWDAAPQTEPGGATNWADVWQAYEGPC